MPNGASDGTHGEGATEVGEDDPGTTETFRMNASRHNEVMLTMGLLCDQRGPYRVVVGVVHRQMASPVRVLCPVRLSLGNFVFRAGPIHVLTRRT